jgi:hypothetical protein
MTVAQALDILERWNHRIVGHLPDCPCSACRRGAAVERLRAYCADAVEANVTDDQAKSTG